MYLLSWGVWWQLLHHLDNNSYYILLQQQMERVTISWNIKYHASTHSTCCILVITCSVLLHLRQVITNSTIHCISIINFGEKTLYAELCCLQEFMDRINDANTLNKERLKKNSDTRTWHVCINVQTLLTYVHDIAYLVYTTVTYIARLAKKLPWLVCQLS